MKTNDRKLASILEKELTESAFQLSVASCVARQHNLPIKRELATAKEAVAEALQQLPHLQRFLNK